MSIKVLRPGLLTSIQDLGRYGYQKHGVIVSGAMDSYSLRLANLLVGNKENQAVLEITLVGPALLIEKDILLAITGGNLSPTVGGQPIPMDRPVFLRKGCILQFGARKSGCRSYLAIAGGYNISEVMGSASTYLRAGLGGFEGRALQTDDVLQLKDPQGKSASLLRQLASSSSASSYVSTKWFLGKSHIPQEGEPVKIRVMRGRQFEQFSGDSKDVFWNCPFQVSSQSDRMGYRLSGAGAVLKLAEPLEMISEAVSLGTVQVPPDGNPIILLADRQTVGGYPKIAQVALVDVAVVAQLKPGSKICFQEISLQKAESLYLIREQEIQALQRSIQLKMQ